MIEKEGPDLNLLKSQINEKLKYAAKLTKKTEENPKIMREIWELSKTKFVLEAELNRIAQYNTDWATPYHSSNTMSKYILDSKSDIFNKESENGGVSIWTILLDRLFNLVKLKADHDKFEDICEERWQQNDSIIKDNFIKFKENSISFIDLEIFSEKMDELRANCENKFLDWITDCSDQEFSLYMTDIAKVMDVACRIVLG